MDAKLKQAIAATRSGSKKEAQVLLTQVLQDDPETVQAWYLLSLLVDSESKQAAYLQKVLALDPDHDKARARLDTLQGVPQPVVEQPPAVTEDERPLPAPPPPTDLAETETVPDWQQDGAFSDVPATEEELAPADLPDWLTQEMAEAGETAVDASTAVDEPTGDQPTLVTAATPDADTAAQPSGEDIAIPETAVDQKADTSSRISRMNRILTILSIGAVILLILLLIQLVANF